jgi:hypothetical protein
MHEWLSHVRKRTSQHFGELIGRDKAAIEVLLFFGSIAVLILALLFALDAKGVNIFVAFFAGIFTGCIWFVLSFGMILLWGFLDCLFCSLHSKGPSKRLAIFYVITSFVITGVVWFATFELAKKIPVVGNQLTYLFRNYDED